MSLRLLLALGLALLAAPAFGQGSVTDLLLFREGKSVRADVRAHHLLDERTTQTIESGFPGFCLYLLRLEDRSGRVVAERLVERNLRYDAWRCCYVLEGEGESRALPTRAAADSAVSRLAICDLCPTSRLDPTEDYQVSLQIAVRPLAPDGAASLAGSGGDRIADANGVTFDLKALFGGTGREAGASGPVLGRLGPFFRAADLREAP